MHQKTLKILVIRFSSIGDIVLTTPVVRGLYRQLNAEVHYITKSAYAELLRESPYVSRIHLLEGSLWKIAKILRAEKFDYIIDLHHNLRSLVLKLLLRVPSYSFYKMNIEKWLFVHFKWPPLRPQHIVERYWKCATPLGLKADTQGLDYFLPQNSPPGHSLLPPSFSKNYVIYAIGSKWKTKKLPLKQMIKLCHQINRPIVLLGGKEDTTTGNELANFFAPTSDSPLTAGLKAMGQQASIYNGCGRFSLHESATLIRDADYVFTHDTGMMHIASAFKKSIYSIWGSTVPEFGMYPYKTRFTVLEKKDLRCRPCSKIGHRRCPLHHFKCMTENPLLFTLPEAHQDPFLPST